MTEIAAANIRAVKRPLRITWDPLFYGRASAMAFGSVDDEWGGEIWRSGPLGVEYLIENDLAYGFRVDLDSWSPDPGAEDIFGGPRFWIPGLGLDDASAGEALLAAQARWGYDDASLDAWLFSAAVSAADESLETAADLWTQVIDTGDLKGVFGLGYTLFDLGRFHEAHAHLRHYTELCPRNTWAWCLYGKSLEAIAESDAAFDAYCRAITLEYEGGAETDAMELLEQLL